MKRPNFFIVGAPKCGTSALAAYLKEHPQIFFSEPKELRYFFSDLPGIRAIENETDYLRHFKRAGEQHVAVGEGSTLYLFSQAALEQIRRWDPDAKIIVMLRNQVDFVHAWHSQVLFMCDEIVSDFETAWRLVPVRRKGEQIPKTCREPLMLDYEELGKLGKHVERLLMLFPKERVLFLLFDEFFSNPNTEYRRVLDFLGVPFDGRSTFPAINRNKVVRSERVAFFLQRPPAFLKFMSTLFKKTSRLERLGAWRFMERINTQTRARVPLKEELRQELSEFFKEDRKKLGSLIKRDLSHWR